MKRRRLKLPAVLSLLILLVTCAMWVRSYWRAGGVYCHGRVGEVVLGYNDGHFLLSVSNMGWVKPRAGTYQNDVVPWNTLFGSSFTGFKHVVRRSQRMDVSKPTDTPSGLVLRPLEVTHFFMAPIGAVALLGAAMLAFSLRRKKFPPGHCVICGYDLRVTPDRCPECGATPA